LFALLSHVVDDVACFTYWRRCVFVVYIYKAMDLSPSKKEKIKRVGFYKKMHVTYLYLFFRLKGDFEIF
jgi:hypothetical protein